MTVNGKWFTEYSFIYIYFLQVGVCSDLAEFLHKYLERQHGDHAGDWAYSLMESINHHLTDELVGLFNDILSGKVMGFSTCYWGEMLLSVVVGTLL